MKATLYPLEQKIEVEGSAIQIAHLHGYLLDVMSQLAPKLRDRQEELNADRPEEPNADRPGKQQDDTTDVDRLLDWMINHGIVPPSNGGK